MAPPRTGLERIDIVFWVFAAPCDENMQESRLPMRTMKPARSFQASFCLIMGVALWAPALAWAEVKTSTQAQSEMSKSLRAILLQDNESIKIDGRLNESAWSRADVGQGFVERSPSPGARPPVQNAVSVLYDQAALYVGVKMDLLPSEIPVGRAMARDTHRIWYDDAITIKFDVHYDRRTTLGFAINLATAQIDFVALENGRSFKTEFDAVWEAKTSVNKKAWFAEFKIPLTALGLPWSDSDRVMGFNVSRDHSLRNATYDWSQMPKGYGPVSALHYGRLLGFKKVGGGVPISLVPYALLQHPSSFKAGGDFKIRVGEDLWVEMTALTDFAQIDLDDPVVNLNRFPLRLPEKRPFFLSGLEIFNFNSSALFFSRRIGLNQDDEEIPIWFGTKVHSRVGPLGVGVLDVITEDDHSAVARARVNLGDKAFVGVMGTLRHELKAEAEIRPAYGVDAALRLFDHRLSISTDWAYAPTDQGKASSAMASGLDIAWLEEPFKPRFILKYVGEQFDPVLGFVRRAGLYSGVSHFLYVARPDFLGLRTLQYTLHGQSLRSSDFSQALGLTAVIGLDAYWRNGWSASAEFSQVEDVVESDFDLLDSVTISSGNYSGQTAQLTVSKNPRSDWRASLNYMIGDHYFGGSLQTLGVQSTLIFNSMIKLSASTSLSQVDLPANDAFQTVTFKSVLALTPSPDIVSYGTLLLVDQDIDSKLDQGVFLFRLRWRYQPGSDVFFVFREDIKLSDEETNERSITLKLNYRFDTVL
jgi:hypothetical protein